jgi:hypothetical protein
MALFKVLRGNEEALPAPTSTTDGYAYFTQDTNNFYINHTDGTKQDFIGIGKNVKTTSEDFAVEIGRGNASATGKNSMAQGNNT